MAKTNSRQTFNENKNAIVRCAGALKKNFWCHKNKKGHSFPGKKKCLGCASAIWTKIVASEGSNNATKNEQQCNIADVRRSGIKCNNCGSANTRYGDISKTMQCLCCGHYA